MKSIGLAAISLLLFAAPLAAQNWAVTVGTGPFVFGDLAERESRVVTESSSTEVTSILKAATRAGVSGEVERLFNDRFSARLVGTFTRSPLSVKNRSESGDGVRLDVGDLNVATFSLLGAFRFNRGGALRPYVAAGPAYALYNMEDTEDEGVDPLFEGTRGRWGVAAAAGVEWWLSERFALRGEISDTLTETPLRSEDFSRPRTSRLDLEDPHNIHTTIAASYRF